MPKTSIKVMVTPVYYIAYFLSMKLKESVGSDLAQTLSCVLLRSTITGSLSQALGLVEAAFHIGPIDYVPPFVDVGASIVLIL